MTRRKVIDKYFFSINSRYYEVILNGVNAKKKDEKYVQNCNPILTSMTFSGKQNATEICKEFKILYELLSTYGKEETRIEDTFSYYDCDFLNYWLNNKLRENVNDGLINVKEFYEQIISNNKEFFSKHEELGNHIYIIDPEILENMKLLYKLYVNAVKIINIVYDKDYKPDERENEEQVIVSQENEARNSEAQESEAQKSEAQENQQQEKEEHKPCSYYAEQLDENYKEAMDRCFNSNDDFYNSLKYFKDSYKIITEPSSNKSDACNSIEFYYFPEYDGVLEKKANAIKISSTLLVLSFALPLIYK
ncbi:PIR Superfamily Protein, partial [Plasmodium ovale curtisi]